MRRSHINSSRGDSCRSRSFGSGRTAMVFLSDVISRFVAFKETHGTRGNIERLIFKSAFASLLSLLS